MSYRRDRCVMQWVGNTMRLIQRGQGVSVNFAGSYCGGAHGKASRLCVFWISMEAWIGWSGIGLMIEGKEWLCQRVSSEDVLSRTSKVGL